MLPDVTSRDHETKEELTVQLRFKVNTKIQKPVEEVFDAIYNPAKLSEYFTTGGASGPLEEGKTVIWQFADFPGEVPVHVTQVIPNRLLAFEWSEGEGETDEQGNKRVVVDDSNMLQVRIELEPLEDGSTLVTISEGEWRPTQKGLDRSYGNCSGWTEMSLCLKAWVEYGINLRKGAH